MGKAIREESVSPFKDFWKSFKMNFKQATLVWLVLSLATGVVILNIRNINLLGTMGKYILPFQFVILFELIVVNIYIYPLLSRYYTNFKNLIKTAFLIGNMHLPTTILCAAIFAATFFMLYKIPGLFILIFIGFYIYCSSYFLLKVFAKHWPEEKTEEPEFTKSELD
jgi:uncharacterized membrane protein YesL